MFKFVSIELEKARINLKIIYIVTIGNGNKKNRFQCSDYYAVDKIEYS